MSFRVVWCEKLRSRDGYRGRIVYSGGDRNQTSEAFNAFESCITDSNYVKWLQIKQSKPCFMIISRSVSPFVSKILKTEKYLSG